MPKKKHRHEEHEEHVNHEAWVIPYADMLTLLMGLFLVLWAISNQDLAKLKEFGAGFGEAVGLTAPAASETSGGPGGDGVLDGGNSPTTVPQIGGDLAAAEALERQEAAQAAQAAESINLAQAEQVITTAAAAQGFDPALSFDQEERGLVVSIVSDDVLFEPGSADLRTDGLGALDAVAAGLAQLPNPISIEGHTDSRPINTARFPSNWELSTARAAAVLRYLAAAHGIDPGRMVAGGYADQRPSGDNATPEGRSVNRRVDIAVLSTVGAGSVPAPTDQASDNEGDDDG